jgi:D-galactarolactone isomerase
MERMSSDRRDFMKAAGVLAMTTAASSLGMRGASAQQVPYSAGTEAPKLKAPANACDCHMHIYNAKYPVDPSATLKPPDALVADYKLLQKRIGTMRNVVVTPSTYGTDNRERSMPWRKSARLPVASPSSTLASPTPSSDA